MKTRIKICGLTRRTDVEAAIQAGADAIGLVFYPPSPRYVLPQQAAQLLRNIPPFITTVGLFVNASDTMIQNTLEQVPLNLLQFHGDETPEQCRRWNRPYLRAARVQPGLDLLQYATSFRDAQALLLDAFVDGYGGGGRTFDWGLIPANLPLPIVLSGGLDPENVGTAIRQVRPSAVDVSSGVESAKGIKNPQRIHDFIRAVRQQDCRDPSAPATEPDNLGVL